MLKRATLGLIVVVGLLLFTIIVLFVELDGNDGVQFHHGWYNWFYDSLDRGWFGFVLVRTVALFLVVLAVRRLWRWSLSIAKPLAILVVLGLAAFVMMTWYSPVGVYGVVDEVEGIGEHYYVFGGGKAEFVRKPYFYILGEKVRAPEDTKVQWGHYEKTAEGWILTEEGEHGRRFKLKFSWFGIWLTNVEAPQSKMIWGRRIIPFLRPDWMPNWLQ